MSHTPTPWHVDDDWDDTVTILSPFEGAEWLGQFDVWPVCYIDRDSDNVEQADIDAAFIVKAVNSHQPLVEALVYIREHLIFAPESGEAIDVLAGPNDIGARIGSVLRALEEAK